MAQNQGRPGELISGINVTPLVDVVLVLLIVLMVSASYTVSQTLPMELPKASTGESKTLPFAVSIDQHNGLYVDGKAVSREELRHVILDKLRGGPVSALIAADGRTEHRSVVSVIDLLRSTGVTQFAINVAPDDLK